MSNAVAAKTITIERDLLPPESVGEVVSMSGIAMSRAMEDVTSFGPGLARDRIPILEDAVDITMEMNFLVANFTPFYSDYLNTVKQPYVVTLPSNLGEFKFTAYTSRLELLSEFDGVIQASVVLSVDNNGVTYEEFIPEEPTE